MVRFGFVALGNGWKVEGYRDAIIWTISEQGLEQITVDQILGIQLLLVNSIARKKFLTVNNN